MYFANKLNPLCLFIMQLNSTSLSLLEEDIKLNALVNNVNVTISVKVRVTSKCQSIFNDCGERYQMLDKLLKDNSGAPLRPKAAGGELH